jgi:FAD-NAD(P)-binding
VDFIQTGVQSHEPFRDKACDRYRRRCKRRVARLSAVAKSRIWVSRQHVLNVRAANMSALPDDPDHFWRWLSNRTEGPLCPDPFCFVPRRSYGDYLASLTTPFTSSETGSPRLTIVHGQCVDVVEGTAGVTTLGSIVSFPGSDKQCQQTSQHIDRLQRIPEPIEQVIRQNICEVASAEVRSASGD